MGNNDLEGRLALITGASGGFVLNFPSLLIITTVSTDTMSNRIGAACARDLARLNVNLALTYSSSPAKVESLITEIRALSPEAAKLRISSHKVDVGVASDLEKLFEEVKKDHDGRVVDILISNAGYGKRIVDVW